MEVDELHLHAYSTHPETNLKHVFSMTVQMMMSSTITREELLFLLPTGVRLDRFFNVPRRTIVLIVLCGERLTRHNNET